jgi:dihydrofolate reductase
VAGTSDLHGVSSFETALSLIADLGPRVNHVFVAGGAQLYVAALPHADRMLLTRITTPSFDDCDTFFPRWTTDPSWHLCSHEALESWLGIKVPEGETEEDDGRVAYRMEMWERDRAAINGD